MIRFHFRDGFADVDFSKVPQHYFRNGFCCDVAWWNGKKYSAYIMLNDTKAFEPSYIDLDEEVDGEDINVLHTVITGAEILSFDQSFVERFDENDDEYAWLDDWWCAQDNETSNACHWIAMSNELPLTDDEERICNFLYNKDIEGECELPDDFNVEEFGEFLSVKYGKEIAEKVKYYENECMETALVRFLNRVWFCNSND